jgi:CelD/BcsL family acetyltransferase involved in cellulose biosynthesis
MPNIVRVSDYKEFKDCKDAWEDLLSRSGADNVFLTHDWIDACIRHFFSKEKLLILNIYDNNRLAGIAPLMIKRHKYFGLPVRSVCFIGTGISDRMDFIMDGEKEKGIIPAMDYLMSVKSEWDFVDLEEMPEQTGTARVIEKYMVEKHIINTPGPSKKSFYIAMGKAGENTGLEFSKKFQRKFKKVNNKWHGLNLSFERYAGTGISKDSVFSELKAIENKSWKGDRHSGIFSNPSSEGFHKDILLKFSKNGLIDLSILNLGARPIAYIYNYLYGKRSYNYSIAYDKKYSNLSPGTLLMLWALADSPLRGIAEFDFARGEGDWKSRFAEDFRTHDRVRIFKNSPYSMLLYYLQSGIMPYLKKRKFMYNLWMKLKGWLGWD